MIGLLDVGVLVALFDPAHVHHDIAHAWIGEHRASGWATCPLTENGFVRVISHPEYPGSRTTVAEALTRLGAFVASGDHHFWPDATSLRRLSRIDPSGIEGHAGVRAAYLLLLAVENEGRLVTFDPGVPRAAVRHATDEHLLVLAG